MPPPSPPGGTDISLQLKPLPGDAAEGGGGLRDGKAGGIDEDVAQVIRLAAAVFPVILFPGSVHPLDHLFGSALVHSQLGGADPQAMLIGGIHPDIQHIRPLPKDGVGAAAHDDAALPGGQILDDVGLGLEQLVLKAQVAGAQGIDAAEEALAVGILRVADLPHRQAQPGGGGLHNVPVVEIDAQLPAHDLGNGPPLAGKLPGKGNHEMLHAAASCFFLILGFCNLRTAQDRAKLITK